MQKSKKILLYPLIVLFSFFWIPRVAFIINNQAPVFDHLRISDFFLSLIFDISTLTYSLIPFSLLLLLTIPRSTHRVVKKVSTLLLFVTTFFILFSCFAEIFFIEEFNSRYNFIAVDYLVYTNEVLHNIWESYPIVWILLGIFAVIIPLFYWFFLPMMDFLVSKKRVTLGFSGLILASALFSFFFINEGKLLSSNSAFYEESSKNSIHTFVHAYQNNEINYFKFYRSIDPEKATEFVHENLEELDGVTNEDSSQEDKLSIVRNIQSPQPAKKMNVILVLMESMSARYLAHYGSQQHITPHLDQLIEQGAWFSQIYATGTRTVRGIEALLIGIPPTPGQSIVRRELGGRIFQLGTVFGQNNYQLNFIYGGKSYFDNMKDFFSDHRFAIHDENTFPAEQISFANAWGVSDEDLFNQVISISNQNTDKNFFNVVLTTSNHRPYTYPENKIDIPSKSGRDGAVKYADYAIGEFIKKAKQQPWFDNTLFIFVADHNASVAGGENIDPADYLVPVIFYSPKNIPPQKIEGMASQIDIPPTILSFLNISYQSKFWGTNLFKKRPGRAFVSTFQKVGLINGTQQVTLLPKKQIETKNWPDNSNQKNYLANEDFQDLPLIKEAISYYTAASYWYSHKLLLEQAPTTIKNIRK